MENYKTRACLRFDEDIRSSNGLKGRNYERERIREITRTINGQQRI